MTTPLRRARSFDSVKAWRAVCAFVLFLAIVALGGCRRSSAISADAARLHVAGLAEAVVSDLGEVRRGLPAGSEFLREYFSAGSFEDATHAREVLERARGKVQDLRVAKPTFFALVDLGGVALRSDRSPDLLAGKSLFAAFPELRGALAGKYVETRGVMDEAAGVRGRKDGQWVAAAPVTASGAVKGIYAAGWSWSSYAYRLETKLRSELHGARKENEHEPLVYVYVLVEKDFFGAPVSPEVNARSLAEQNLLGKAPGPETLSLELEITGRQFGVAFKRTPELGKDVGVVVLRSET